MQQAKRVANGLIVLNGIATTTGIDEIQIIEPLVRMERLRLKMIEFKFARDLSPRFSLQAIDATAQKLIAKPISIRFV